MTTTISFDFETRATIELKRSGIYPYAKHEDTDVWCLAWAFEDRDVQLWVPGMSVPIEWELTASDPDVQYRAWNAQFERIIWRDLCMQRYGFPEVPLEQWHCTSAEAAAMALPRALGQAAEVLGTPYQKDKAGHKLMMQMTKPRSKKGVRPLVWWDDEDRRKRLYSYCMDDVRAERAIIPSLRRLSSSERDVYLMDQEINDRGVLVDAKLVHAAHTVVDVAITKANAELERVTGGAVAGVTKVKDLTAWLQKRGTDVDSIRKAVVRDLLATDTLSAPVRTALEIRQEAGRSSTAKLNAFQAAMGEDERIRGLFLYHGASPGRWAGKLVQPQNMPRPSVKDIEGYIDLVMREQHEIIDAMHAPLAVVSSMLRSMLCAKPGHRFLAGDFAQVEARALAWLAGQKDQLVLFAAGGSKVYQAFGEKIFGHEVVKGTEKYQLSKNMVLGCGYQMGPVTFVANVLEQDGIDLNGRCTCGHQDTSHLLVELDRSKSPKKEVRGACNLCNCAEWVDFAPYAISLYRKSNAKIKQLWYDYQNAAFDAVRMPGTTITVGRIKFSFRGAYLWVVLPSGRPLAYAQPAIRMVRMPWTDDDDAPVYREAVTFAGVDSMTRQWRRRPMYGGLLAENVTQATARDLLSEAMLRLRASELDIVMHAHDEAVSEVPLGVCSQAEYEAIMSVAPAWADGLPIEVEGWEGERFRK